MPRLRQKPSGGQHEEYQERAYEHCAHCLLEMRIVGAWGPSAGEGEAAPREMAGEVQTPVTGDNAAGLRIGDRVWFRHTKSGELSEHVEEFALVEGGEVVGAVPTYRGEGKAFL